MTTKKRPMKAITNEVVEIKEVQTEVQTEIKEAPIEITKTEEVKKDTETIKESIPIELVDGRIWFKKIGGGSLHWGNRFIKPNERIKLFPGEISENFKDVLIPMSAIPEPKPAPTPKGKSPIFTLTPRKGEENKWDVVMENGKKLNQKALDKEVAEQLMKDLQS